MATKDFSTKQERSIADYLDWEVVPGSGARNFHPGDIRCERFLGECKTHMSESSKIVFYREVWDKIKNEAMSQMKIPVLFVDDGTQKINRTWCLFPHGLIPTWQPNTFFECQSEVFYPSLCSRTNIHLDPLKGRSILKDYSMPDYAINYLSMNWNDESICMLPLPMFKDLLEIISNL